ncbi:MAG: YkgJ family cysteine cluster protein [Chitinophagaceae bacterium]|nr:YkgJ family cysteine cluster protein [Chitinophagaceae bacterium]
MQAVNFRSFKQKVRHNKKRLRSFLTRLEKNLPKGLDKLAASLEKEVWQEVDCLSCANCCKTMSPTFTQKDIKRISKHFDQTPDAFTKQWLRKDRIGDMLNKTEPCQFLNLTDNKCSIYAIRPTDCSGFPHLHKKTMPEYMHVHKQNIEYCPATYKLVEKMQEAMLNG